MSFTIKKYQSEDKSLWDSFVQTAKNATFLFQRDFMDYHSDRFEDFSLMVYKEDTLFALLPANKKGDTVYSHQGLTYGSFILLENAKLLDSCEAFKSLLHYLNTQNITYLDIRIIPSFYNTLPSDELEYFMFKTDAALLKRDIIMLVDYRNKMRFQKNRREGINKAVRNKLRIQIDTNFDGFWNEILIPNLKQKHAASPIHSLEEITLLGSRFPKQIVQVNVYKENNIVAGSTIFLTKTTIHPQYVSGNEDKNTDGSLDFLYNFLIHEWKIKKDYFDFNTSSENNGTVLNKGLIFWKESCGARSFANNNYLVKTSSYASLNIDTK